ncbi:glycosyltransferase family 2 protein [Hymenobacter psychrotolerans]|uniref:Glycosyltransferase, GT2 family n=1 Tax=Hymenobacter psychrotolerans DSM 18569 TaxID=1121959 RepID=A0A1M7B3E5_9BACT|nr:glycosyltransferase [Hymenobacter psychrotolerans]SHL49189.1 Glycosyltransferase, GT2 family [Hymenobacter psychrotolerans DSM 18569]
MKLSVVIVNYNVCYFLEQALLSVRRAVEKLGQPVEVFVVDNNSVDGSVAMVKARFPEVILIENKDNPGFSKANNQALRIATGEYQLLLNPDTVVEEDTFRICCEFMDAHPNTGGLGVKMLDGQGKFLPESKRGLPTPWVAFYKIFGLAKLFPRSRRFGRYHLGFLDKDQTHEIEVLSGAFMLMRKATLDQVGLLDEDYFMYGEDIDLSYRITQGGWQNHYLPTTRIIHYKGESTKRTSVNYVFVFYRAMVIFAQKHFAPGRAGTFSLLINAAIWLRAGAAVAERLLTQAAPVLLDAGLIYGGMYFLKTYWEQNHKYVPTAYPPQFMLLAVPAYIAVWLSAAYLSGAYDKPTKTARIVRGIFVGTVLISAISNFFDAWRFSKALIILGGVWAVMALVGRRLVAHFLRYRDLRLSERRQKNVAIVGSSAESQRVRHLLEQAAVQARIIGYITPQEQEAAPTRAAEPAPASVYPAGYGAAATALLEPEPMVAASPDDLLGEVRQLDEIIRIYALDELIFCGRDLSASQIISLMVSLPQQPPVAFKILPQDSEYIIGSSSKDSPGDYYTLDITLNLFRPEQVRNKRLLDIVTSLLLLLGAPLLLWLQQQKGGFLRNCLRVLTGSRTWVGLRYAAAPQRLARAILSPADVAQAAAPLTAATRRRLELLYAKDYEPGTDLRILLRRFRWLGQE